MKESKADFLRRWGLPYPKFQFGNLRYKHPPEKGVFWYFFSIFVRLRDVLKWGTCISCGRPITFDTCQAGHFMPASNCGRDLLFNYRNVNAECPRCNGFDEAHLLGYAEGLDKRYGEGTAANLRKQRDEYLASKSPLKDFGREYYENEIRKIKVEIETLSPGYL